VVQAMKDLIMSPDYPCVPALRSFERGEYMVELCQGAFGTGSSADKIAHGLTLFRERQKRNGESFLSFWAVWEAKGG
jgi:FPC/CPF motif-containing protein YcgG